MSQPLEDPLCAGGGRKPAGSAAPKAAAKPRTCLPCRQSKTRCNKRIPCDRCIRLDLICQPQIRTRGRPLKLHKRRSEIIAEQMQQQREHGEQGIQPSESTQREKKGELSISVSWPPRDLSGTMELRVCHEAFAMGLYGLKRQGALKTDRLFAITKTWASENYRRGVDITRGLIKYVMELLGPSVSTERDMSIGPHDPNATDAELDMVRAGADHVALPSFVERLDDGVSAFCGYYFYRGQFVHFANESFSRLYMHEKELNDRFRDLAVIPAVVWAKALVPEDHSEFFSSMIRYTFTPPSKGREMSMLVHTVDRSGCRRLCLARVRYVLLLEGTYSSLVMSLMPMPGQPSHTPSAHVSPTNASTLSSPIAGATKMPTFRESKSGDTGHAHLTGCLGSDYHDQLDSWGLLEEEAEQQREGGSHGHNGAGALGGCEVMGGAGLRDLGSHRRTDTTELMPTVDPVSERRVGLFGEQQASTDGHRSGSDFVVDNQRMHRPPPLPLPLHDRNNHFASQPVRHPSESWMPAFAQQAHAQAPPPSHAGYYSQQFRHGPVSPAGNMGTTCRLPFQAPPKFEGMVVGDSGGGGMLAAFGNRGHANGAGAGAGNLPPMMATGGANELGIGPDAFAAQPLARQTGLPAWTMGVSAGGGAWLEDDVFQEGV